MKKKREEKKHTSPNYNLSKIVFNATTSKKMRQGKKKDHVTPKHNADYRQL